MDRANLYAAIKEEMSHVILQARAMLERGFIKELPYDATDLAHAGLGMIVASFRNACYHRDTIALPKLGTFQPAGDSVQFTPGHNFNVISKFIFKCAVLAGETLTEEALQKINAEMAIVKLSSNDLLKIISEQLAPIYLSASPQEIAETLLSAWEDAIANFLKMGGRVHLSGIGKFSFHEYEVQKIIFVPDDVLIRAIRAGDYRRRNRHLYSEDL